MAEVVVPRDKLDRLFKAVEELAEELHQLSNLDRVALNRLAELEANPQLALPEEKLKEYLRSRGVDFD